MCGRCVYLLPVCFPPQRAVNDALKEARRVARIALQVAQERAAFQAQKAEKGRFDPLEAIMNPEPAQKVRRKRKSKQPEKPSTPPVEDNDEVLKTEPVLLRPNLAPKKVHSGPRVCAVSPIYLPRVLPPSSLPLQSCTVFSSSHRPSQSLFSHIPSHFPELLPTYLSRVPLCFSVPLSVMPPSHSRSF